MQSSNPSTQQNFIEGNFVYVKRSLTKRHLIICSLGSAVAHGLWFMVYGLWFMVYG